MSGASSSAGEWSTRLEPARPSKPPPRRADDPRLWEIIERWDGNARALQPGRVVLIGFPQDAGVRRNGGRVGAAKAPDEIRSHLGRLTPWDGHQVDLAVRPPLYVGNVRVGGSLEKSQEALGDVVAAILVSGALPVVLGGGHETAYGHYLGYVKAGRPVGIINIDAHLDVRPCIKGRGHSGSPFRQALEHPTDPLPGPRYVCLGAQPHSVSRAHLRYAEERGCVVRWCGGYRHHTSQFFLDECKRLADDDCQVYVTIDADAVRMTDVPGVSAPNVGGFPGEDVLALARYAGWNPHVSSLDLVEVNPRLDRDGQSARWAALVVWNFLMGHAQRGRRRVK
jgi:formiminoglutamase